ncbi:MAG: hypothetical protein ACPG31_09835 [Planctomycetota bacterium]
MLSLVLAASALFAAPLPAQDPVEFGRLATEQRQVAEQVRRLNQLLEMLEKRDLEEGREDRAALIAQARERLSGAAESGNLAAAVEGVARDLAALHTGNALEGQAELIQILQDLLDYLIETERKEQEMALEKALQDRIESLENFEKRQAEILKKTQQLEQAQRRQDGETQPQDGDSDPQDGEQDPQDGEPRDPQDGESEPQDGESRPQDGEPQDGEPQEREAEPQDGDPSEQEGAMPEPANQEEIDQLREELAELQEQLAQDLKEFNREQESETGRRSEETDQAEDASEQAAEELRQESAETQPQDQAESLREAIEQEKKALEKLKEAKEKAENQQEQSDEAKRREALLNVMEEAQIILDRHISLEQELQVLDGEIEGDRVPRSARTRLRQIALAEKELGVAAEQLLLTIADAGADSFPLYIQGLMLDHESLAKEIGPPRYRIQGKAMTLAASLTADWQQLIEVIRIEQERIRRRLEEQEDDGTEQDGGGGGSPEEEERPLVDFAMELQLLKRMQASLAERLVLAHDRLQTFADAGVELGPEDTLELESLLERQGDLQLQFESMVRRLQGTDETDQAEEI